MQLTRTMVSLLLLSGAAAGREPYDSDLAAGDAHRTAGELDGALAHYRAALAEGAPRAATLRRVGEVEERLGRWKEAEEAYAAALAADPRDGDARDDLRGLRLRRGLALRADLGGTEPGTSRQAFEGAVKYGGIERMELLAGYSYSDQVYYWSNRAFVTAYRFYGRDGSWVKGDLTLRRYSYPVDPAVLRPQPDSNAYDWVPRAEAEISHVFSPALRAAIAYQLFPANFFYDTSSWAVNNKLSGEVEVRPLDALRLTGIVAALRDPDPSRTEILGRRSPVTGAAATATRVDYRVTSLLGGAAAVDLGRIAVELRYLPNRDLDNSYRDSILTTIDLRVHERASLRLQQVHDWYGAHSNYAGRTADIVLGEAAYDLSPSLQVRGGYRYVDAPTRTGGTILLGLGLRTGIL